MASNEPFWLLNPGPINVPTSVREALAACPDRCHREPEYLDCQTRVRDALPADQDHVDRQQHDVDLALFDEADEGRAELSEHRRPAAGVGAHPSGA